VARVFVAFDGAQDIVGFYSLSSFTLAFEHLPVEIAAKLPRYDAIPAALIGRLARDERVRGQRVGELLLADAVSRVLKASQTIAVFAIVVEAANAKASEFYREFGFRPFPLHPTRLFLLTSTAKAAMEKV
jgi:predicted GNAT family N-acyltransferase